MPPFTQNSSHLSTTKREGAHGSCGEVNNFTTAVFEPNPEVRRTGENSAALSHRKTGTKHGEDRCQVEEKRAPSTKPFSYETSTKSALNRHQVAGKTGTKYGENRHQVEKQPALSRHTISTKPGLRQQQITVLLHCDDDKRLVELMAMVGRSDRTKFRDQVLAPLLAGNFLEMTVPDKPRSSKQHYRLTEVGRDYLKIIAEDHGED